jgi:polyphosphate glucokinase
MSPSQPRPAAPAGAAPSALRSEAIPLTGLALGIDVGGTGVKAALVDLATAELVTSRVREKTPQPSTPPAVIETIATVVERVLAERPPEGEVPIGCGLPGAIKHGTMKTAANVDAAWIDFDATSHLAERLGRPVYVINDADAAGMAELAYGEARGQPGTVILLTVGTGIGSALISEGRLVPNTEFGHLLMRNKGAETLVGGAARLRRKLGWKRWARDFNEYLAMLEFFLWPDRIILGGGVSKEWTRYWSYLRTNAELVKARYLNTSGIIGAAYAAALAAHEGALAAREAGSQAGEAGTPAPRAPAPGALAEREAQETAARDPEGTSAPVEVPGATSAGTRDAGDAKPAKRKGRPASRKGS